LFDTVTKNFVFLAHLGDWGYRALLHLNRIYNNGAPGAARNTGPSAARSRPPAGQGGGEPRFHFEEHIAELAHLRGCVGVMWRAHHHARR